MIEVDPSKVGRKNVYFVRIGSIPRTLSVNTHIARQQLNKEFNLGPPKLNLYQLTKIIAANIGPHISSALKDQGVILINLFYIEVPNWRMQNVQVLQTNSTVQKTN